MRGCGTRRAVSWTRAADTAVKAAEQKAATTPDDSSTPASALRVLPSVVAIVAANVAATFA